MIVVIVLGLALVTLFGIRVSYTDIATHKAYNKDVVIFSIMGTILQICTCIVDYSMMSSIISNLIFTTIIGYVFFHTKVWAAGDAKAFATFILLFPSRLYMLEYGDLFPGFYVLGLTFSFALIYVVIESIVFLIMDIKSKEPFGLNTFIPKINIEAIVIWGIAYLAVHCFDDLIYMMNIQIILNNQWMLYLINILFATFVLAIFDTKSKKLLLFIISAFTQVGIWIVNKQITKIFTPSLLIIILSIVIIKHFTSKYNYRTIPTSKVRVGQILAESTIIFMLPSKVKGLPTFTDETTKCRLNEENVNAIKRWEFSKYGSKEIVIVRHIPFTPFMFLGVLAYILLSLVKGGLI